jgi:hypothetical protein
MIEFFPKVSSVEMPKGEEVLKTEKRHIYGIGAVAFLSMYIVE